MKIPQSAHWRDSARRIKFFVWDGQAAFPMMLFFLHMRLWTFIAAFVAMAFFTLLNRYGFTPIVFFRWLRSALAGPIKQAQPPWMRS